MIGGVLANQIAVNAVWFACAFGASTGRPWLGALAALTWVAFYLGQSLRPRSEAILVIAAGLTGLACDAVLVGAGALSYAGQPLAPGLGPLWIVALWMSFATSLNVSLPWLRGRPAVAALMGAVCGPLSYLAGARFGAIFFPASETLALTLLAALWSLALPGLNDLSARLARSTLETADPTALPERAPGTVRF